MSDAINIQETRDWLAIWSLYELPEIEDRVTDDQWSALTSIAKKYQIMRTVEEPKSHTLLVMNGKDCLGCFLLVWTYEKDRGQFHMVHTLLTRQCRGADALQAGKLGIEKAFSLEDVDRLESWCPENNPESYLFARLCGFKKTGFAPVEFVKNMQRFPIRLVALSRDEWNQSKECHSNGIKM